MIANNKMPFQVPSYDKLPIQENAPPGSSWGVFDREGSKDALGTLNFITPEAVLLAKEEIIVGESVTLKYLSARNSI